MHLKRHFVEGLAHASYLFGADGEAAIVDPKRDVDDYLADASAAGLKIVAVLNTHPHADFASGFREIAERTGTKLYTSHLAPVQYDRVPARDGQRIRVGSLEVEMIETPGHSPDSLSFLVREGGQPTTVFTGDLLFVNDVGRPDLRDADSDPRQLAGALYDSLFGKILSLPDQVKVYPAHGAGSLCGRALGSAPFTTVGQEKQVNWAAQLTDRAEFVKQMLANLPDRPAYFSFDVGVNLRGAPPLSALPPLRAFSTCARRANGRRAISKARHICRFPSCPRASLRCRRKSPSPSFAAAVIGARSRRACFCAPVIHGWRMSWAAWAHTPKRNASRWCLPNWFLPGTEFN
jgi:glyoxylase-like metal-dependent hydrolase (beta-lactamase superfamily II)